MKFLIIQKIKREVPIEKWAKLLPLQFKYFDNLEKEKTLEVTYHLIGQQGTMLIVNVDSDEKLSKVIGQDPLFFECDREIYPLTTRQTHEKQIRNSSSHNLAMSIWFATAVLPLTNQLDVHGIVQKLYCKIYVLA
jgi:hypothetical protein